MKYIIEIEDEPKGGLYKAKNFNTLVFDRNGLDKLKRYSCAKHEAIRAFSDNNEDFYRLTKDLGMLKAGSIFHHDRYDDIRGSVADGCLKLCWTPDGDCYGGLCGGTVVFHTSFIESDLFERAEPSVENICRFFKSDTIYKVQVIDGKLHVKACGIEGQ